MSPPISPRFVLPEPHPTQDKGHPSLTPHSCSSEREAVRHQALVRDEEITSRGGNTSSAHVLTRTNHATWTGPVTRLFYPSTLEQRIRAKLMVRIRRDGRSSGSQVSEVLTCDHRRGGPIALLSRSSPSRRSPHRRHGRIATISLGRGGCLDRLALRCTSCGCRSAARSSISNGSTSSAKRAERFLCSCDVCCRAGFGSG